MNQAQSFPKMVTSIEVERAESLSMTMKELRHVIESSTRKHRQNLAKITNASFGDSTDSLCNQIKFLRYGAIGQMFADPSWKQIVTDVADHIVIDWVQVRDGRKWKDVPDQEIEAAVVAKLFRKMMEQATPEQRQQILMELERHTDDPSLVGVLTVGGAIAGGMIVGRMQGFGLYIAASTVLGGATSALGITLPFAAYIGMSQAIALLLSPIGWVALVGGVVGGVAMSLNQPNWNRLQLAIVYVALMRSSPKKVINLEQVS
jgi:hypothetical protein